MVHATSGIGQTSCSAGDARGCPAAGPSGGRRTSHTGMVTTKPPARSPVCVSPISAYVRTSRPTLGLSLCLYSPSRPAVSPIQRQPAPSPSLAPPRLRTWGSRTLSPSATAGTATTRGTTRAWWTASSSWRTSGRRSRRRSRWGLRLVGAGGPDGVLAKVVLQGMVLENTGRDTKKEGAMGALGWRVLE